MIRTNQDRSARALSLIAIVVGARLCPGGESVDPSPAVLGAREQARRILEAAKIPGMSVAVGRGDRLVWSEAFGQADREAGRPATPATTYRIGSVSKLITVAALAVLLEKKAIDLDAPIGKYLPGYPDAEGRITVGRLAGHLAGVRHYNGLAEVMSQQHCETVTDALEVFRKDALESTPGEKYFYSSYGYVLISAAIEKAAGGPFLQFVDEAVLAPLKMASTRPEAPGEKDAERSAYYVTSPGGVNLAPPMDVSCRWAAGGYTSTAEDLARFLLAHVDGQWLKPATVELLFTPMKLANGESTQVGVGWRVAKDDKGRRFVHHGGAIAGGRAFVLLYPEEKVAVAICSNLGGAAFAEKEAQAVAAFFLPASK